MQRFTTSHLLFLGMHTSFLEGRQTVEYTTAYLCSDWLYVLIGMV